MREPWRYRCPEGHSSIQTRQHGGYRCHSCGCEYAAEPVDAKTGDGDADAEPETPIPTITAARLVRQATGDASATVHARELSTHPRAMTDALRRAADRGLVERVERSLADRWMSTEQAAFLAPRHKETSA